MKLSPLPESFETTRNAMHQIAFFAVSPTRYKAHGRMGLTATPGGYGFPSAASDHEENPQGGCAARPWP